MFAEGSGFPPLLARWLRSLLGGPIPAQPRTTCGDCPMLRPEFGGIAFDPKTKCCTFMPQLPSFNVGTLLLDDDPALAAGRARVRERVEAGEMVTPIGLGRPISFAALYQPESAFGRARALRCPYYVDDEGGGCGIWRHREATCATWFCRRERGMVGLELWTRVHELFKNIEFQLAAEIGMDLGIDRDAMAALESDPFNVYRDEDPYHYRGIWGPWAGREIEYFIESARRVMPLAWTDVRARCGPRLDAYVESAREAQRIYEEQRSVPLYARVIVNERLGADATRVRLRTFSAYDPLDVAPEVADAIARFADRPVAEVGLDDDMVRKLLDYGVLDG